MQYLKFFVGFLLVLSAVVQIVSSQMWWFIQNVNLIFHEAGHVIFFFFGNFMYTLGGSLTELLIPSLVVLHFVHTRQYYSAGVACWWLATAFVSVSVYAADAQERMLPLITNDVTTHDWYNLLLGAGLLRYDDLIGYLFLCGAMTATAGIIFFMSKDKTLVDSLTGKK